MAGEEFSFSGRDGKDIHTYLWQDAEQPRGVLQIIHGMAEHAGRYADFAAFLNSRGYIVYADDHRGHGKTAGAMDEVGYLGRDGFNMTVEDEHILNGIIKEKHPNLPVFILGHSYGSFLAQEYIIRFGAEIPGAILTGSAMKDGNDVRSGVIVSSMMLALGKRKRNKLINSLSFNTANSRIPNPRTPFDWISRDTAEVDKYVADPYCGGIFTTSFYHSFFRGLRGLYKAERLGAIPLELPIFILSGNSDPIGAYGKDVQRLYNLYLGLGIKDVSLKLFEDGRHEILNETNRQEVYETIVQWLDRHLPIYSSSFTGLA